jgi:hypothetical protein
MLIGWKNAIKSTPLNLCAAWVSSELEVGMFSWSTLDRLDKLFVIWAFFLQIVLILHFALRKPFFESYTQKYGWIVYALGIPAVAISLFLLRGGKSWHFWLGGFLFLIYAAFGFWVDYVAKIPFRDPFVLSVGLPYVFLYLAAMMFYWWPLWPLNRALWFAYMVLYIISMIINITSH